MSKTQERAIRKFRRFLEANQIGQVNGHDKVISKWEVKEKSAKTVMISAWIDAPTLGEGNLVRALEREFWLVFVGPRGSLTASSYPKSFNQFRNKKRTGFGIHFN